MAESNDINGPPRRRSARLSPRQADLTTDNKMARPGVAVKRSITVRKIAPRKTTVPSEHNKENTPRRSASGSVQQNKPKVSTLSPVPSRRGSSPSKKKQKAAVPSPILPSPPPPPPPALVLQQPAVDPDDNKIARPGLAVKRSITVRKIAPRKTTVLSEHSKENTPRRSASGSVQEIKPKVSTISTVPDRRGSSSSKKKQKAAVPSPILPSTPPPPAPPSAPVLQQPAVDPADVVWTQKVRRSYSRLGDNSFSSPESRETLFGFEKLNTPEVIRRGGRGLTETRLEVSRSMSGLCSFTSMLEADDCTSAFPEPDPNIPGVAVVKEKRRRKKVQQIDTAELNQLAAKMNAEFEEAEDFELTVE